MRKARAALRHRCADDQTQVFGGARRGRCRARNPAALWIVQGETVLDSLGSACRRLDPLRRYLDLMPAGKLKLQAVKAQQHLEFVIHLGHESSYQDLIA
jgi:hypothetical protein